MGRQNLILITIDCLRADHCGFMGYSRPTTRTLDALARASIVFENAQVAGAPTYYSFPAILASRYPLSLGRDVLGVPSPMPTLATALRDAGYTTAGFTANNPYLSHWFGYDQGFETYEDFGLTEQQTVEVSETSTVSNLSSAPFYRGFNRAVARFAERLPIAREIYNELDFHYCYGLEKKKYAGAWDAARKYPNAAEVTRRALAWLHTQAQTPFFIWLHYMDPHHPRYPSSQSLASVGAPAIDTEREFFLNNVWMRSDIARRYRKELIALYDAGIRDVDKQIDGLLKELMAFDQREQTAVVVASDHGEEFFEHGRLGHSPPSLYQSLAHVPLVIQSASAAPERINPPFGLIDLAPTLLSMLNVEIPSTFQGTTRWKSIASHQAWTDPVIAEVVRLPREPRKGERALYPRVLSVRQGQHKLLFDLSTGDDTLFDLAQDPAERQPLPRGAARDVRRQLLLAAREHLRRSQVRSDDPMRLQARVTELRQRLEQEYH